LFGKTSFAAISRDGLLSVDPAKQSLEKLPSQDWICAPFAFFFLSPLIVRIDQHGKKRQAGKFKS
jgi:hypothetical protein